MFIYHHHHLHMIIWELDLISIFALIHTVNVDI